MAVVGLFIVVDDWDCVSLLVAYVPVISALWISKAGGNTWRLGMLFILSLLPTAFAMDGSTSGNSGGPLRCILSRLDYTAWVVFASMLESYCRLGTHGDKCALPFQFKDRELYVRRQAQTFLESEVTAEQVGGADALAVHVRAMRNMTMEEYRVFMVASEFMTTFDDVAAAEKWSSENELLYWRLAGATAHCHEAQLIVRKHGPPAYAQGDGRGAYDELEAAACGYGPGGESMEGNLTQLFSMDVKDVTLKSLVTTHYDLYQRIMAMQDVNVDTILKHSLLRYIREHPDYVSLQSVEDKCADPEVDYKKANKMVMETIARKAAHFASGSSALLGAGRRDGSRNRNNRNRSRDEREREYGDGADVHCYKCGMPGIKSNTPHTCNIEGSHRKHAKFDREKALRLLGRPKPDHTVPSMLANPAVPQDVLARLDAVEALVGRVTSRSGADGSAASPAVDAPLADGWMAIVVRRDVALSARPKPTPANVVTAVLDTGATMHIFGDKAVFATLRPSPGFTVQGISGVVTAAGVGTVSLIYESAGSRHAVDLHDCLYVPNLPHNLLSCRRLIESGADVDFSASGASVGAPWLTVRLVAGCDAGLWVFRFRSEVKAHHALIAPRAPASSSATAAVWHRRFAHSPISGSLVDLRSRVRDLRVTKSADLHDPTTCRVCRLYKAKRRPHGDASGFMTSSGPAQLVHVDGAEPAGMPRSKEGYRGFYVFVDDFDSSVFVAGYSVKSQALQCYQAYFSWVRATLPAVAANGAPTRLSVCVKSDYASELSAGDVKRFLEQYGHGRLHSSPHAPSENSVAERAVQTVKTYGRVLHHDASFRPDMWYMAVSMAAFILMFLPATRNGGVTPYERRWNATPTVSFLRAPGCLVYYYNYTSGKAKFTDQKAKMGVLVGYDLHSRSYKVLSLDSDRVIRSSDCAFDENVFPLASAETRAPKQAADERTSGLQHGQVEGDAPLQLPLRQRGDDTNGSNLLERYADDILSTDDSNLLQRYSDAMPSTPVSSTAPVLPIESSGAAEVPRTVEFDEEVVNQEAPSEDWIGDRFETPDLPVGATRSGSSYRSTTAEAPPRVLHALAFVAQSTDQNEVTQLPNEPEYGYAFRVKGGTETVFGIYEPGSYKEAISCPDADRWRESMAAEWEALKRLSAFEQVPLKEVPPGVRPISSRWVFKVKPDKLKSRLVIRGFLQDTSGLSTFAPTVKMMTLRLLIALATFLGWPLHQMDVCNAFLNADLPDPNTFMRLPEGYEQDGMVVRLKKALYGLKNSPREWNLELSNYLRKIGLRRSVLDACLFVLVDAGTVVLLLAVHVDDLIITGKPANIAWLVAKMKSAFKMEDLGRPETILGMDIHYETDGSIRLCQESYINKLLHRFGNSKPFKPRPTPMEQGCKLTKKDESTAQTSFPYRELVASLLYLAICTRPDIAFTVKELSRFLNFPGKKMIAVAMRCLHYVGTFKSFGLRFHYELRKVAGAFLYTGAPVTAYSDASFADGEDRRSTAGGVVMFNGTAIMWWSKTLKTVALSSQDAELMALSDCTREVVFLQNLLDSVGYSVPKVRLHGDNVGSLFVAENPGDHQKTKHIEVRYFFVRQKVEEGRVVLRFVPTAQQYADGLTKALAKGPHREGFATIQGFDEFPSAEIHIGSRHGEPCDKEASPVALVATPSVCRAHGGVSGSQMIDPSRDCR